MVTRTRATENTEENAETVTVDASKPTNGDTKPGDYVPKRSTTGKIPSKGGRPLNTYSEWQGEIADLKQHLGEAFSYENTPHAATIVQGLRRIYGVKAVSRDLDKDTKAGTVWIEYPSKDDGNGNLVPNEDEVERTKAKYANK